MTTCGYLACAGEAAASVFVAGRWIPACEEHRTEYVTRYGSDLVGPVSVLTEIPDIDQAQADGAQEEFLGIIDPGWTLYIEAGLDENELRALAGDR
jgi:hypothetical protein